MIRVTMKLPLEACVDFPVETVDPLGSLCLGCNAPLNVMQPDADDPYRFLGSCGTCKRWFHIEVDEEGGQVWFLAVPRRDEINPATLASVRGLGQNGG